MKQNAFGGLRTVLCVIVLIAAYVCQTSLGLRVSIFGAHIDLLPPLLAAVGVAMGSGAGMVCGLAVGLLYDISGSGIDGVYPLYYMIWGIACGFFGERYRTHALRCTLVCALGMTAAIALLRYLFELQFDGADLVLFACGLLPKLALMAVCTPLVYWLVNRIAGSRRGRHAPPRTE